jgi:hypothetical protein
MPARDHVFSKRDLSTFNNQGDVGVFVPVGLGLICRVIVFGLSFVVRGAMTE